jgi:predicted transcriptional regulator of viral defense system
MKPKQPSNPEKLYSIAEPQAGYFTTLQAQAAGLTRPLLSYFVKTGRFKRVAQGIYRISQFPNSPQEDLFVAWLRTGPDSVISHDSALSVYELSDALPGEIHVIIPRTASRRHRGLRLHTHRIQPDEITRRAGLPVTTVARTIADVAASGMAEELVHQAIADALRRGLVTVDTLKTQAARHGGRAARLIQSALNKKAK